MFGKVLKRMRDVKMPRIAPRDSKAFCPSVSHSTIIEVEVVYVYGCDGFAAKRSQDRRNSQCDCTDLDFYSANLPTPRTRATRRGNSE
jgi:hypothetical protein